ncbi:MAG: ABC transporter ATP-binding protein [Candidatus Omnitrophica bacterium]|nr:ABC transporter ATP-binding protein [Candidatus Omnitrophota bacterium]
MSAISIKDLYCGYDTFLLSDINLEVESGQILGIIGPNGSGKTTLLKAITGLLKPRRGEILLDDNNLFSLSRRELARKIAVVAANSDELSLSVEEYVLLGRIPHYGAFQFLESDKDFAIARQAMEQTKVSALKNHSILKISAGERQLTSLARAICQDPSLFLLDEPTSHLDIAHQIGTLNLIGDLHQQKKFTVIMVLHDLNLAAQYCQRLVLLNQGKIVKIGTPSQVLTSDLIEKVYKTPVIVKKDPTSQIPYMFLQGKRFQKPRIS